MTLVFVAAGCLMLGCVGGFFLGQMRAEVVEEIETSAYAIELERMRRRLGEAEARERRADVLARRARRQIRYS